ncbi:acetylcholine receptor subunit alpha-like 1 isoform X1 [Clytia hemisphaerica]|uniref:Uncharacterized protein n=1 Tax=Clytia hemisphaerica TaxID=252671 RepID=A0A7M6DMR8_9CNID
MKRLKILNMFFFALIIFGFAISFTNGNDGNRTRPMNETNTNSSATRATATDIYDKLFGNDANYQAEIRPHATNGKRQLSISFDINIQTIGSLNVKTQLFHVTSVIFMKWFDYRLTWNATEFNGIDTINVGNTIAWTPDIMLYNDGSEEVVSHTDLHRSKVLIKDDGQLIWTNLVTNKATCQVDVTWFPMDEQVCNLTFGSWSYSKNVMDIKFKNKKKDSDMIKSGYHIPNGEWDIEKVEFFEEEKSFDCCQQPFSVVTLQVSMVRYPDFYYLYVFLPFISQLILFLLIFHIHPDQGDRLSYGVALLLNMTMYMIFLSDKLPEKSDKIPFVGTVFVAFFFLLSIGLVLSAITMKYSKHETNLPKSAHKIKRLLNKISPTRTATLDLSNEGACFPESFNLEEKNSSKITKNSSLIQDKDFINNIDRNGNSQNGLDHQTIESSTNHDMDASNSFQGWYEYMRFVEKCLTFVFAVLMVLVPIIVAYCLK